MDMKELSVVLRQAGVVGAGGAGFPAYAKLDQRTDVLILNCAECEPLLKLHRQLLEKYAREIVSTFHLIAEAVGAGTAVIGIKKSYLNTIAALRECISAYPEIRLELLEEFYPAGDEVVLIYEAAGIVIPPGRLPIDCGVAVFNVETVYNAYRALFQERPVIDKLVTIAGAVRTPVTVRLPLGCSLAEAVGCAGGPVIEHPFFFVGGPMMGRIGSGFQPVTKTTNGVLILPEDHLLVRKRHGNTAIDLKRAAAACCQCSMCTDLCPRHLLGHPIEPHKFMRAAIGGNVQDTDSFLNTFFCSSCGLCENYSCMQGLSPRTLIAECKDGLKAHGLKPDVSAVLSAVSAARDLRRAPVKRLMARLDLTKYESPAPLTENLVTAKRVKIMFSQHIGQPAVPVVRNGETVSKGQMIGQPAAGLSVAVHASIDGRVEEVTNEYAVIQSMD